jgi:hypothetical protein
VTKIAYWKAALEKPLEQRIGPAPDELVAYVVLDNITQGIENTPQSMAVSEDLLGDVRAALAELPFPVRQLLSENLVGIYFVRDLGGTAYTDYVAGDSIRRAAGFVMLDMDVLGQRIANDWATWKESSPFKADPMYRLEAEIERDGGNTRKNAIQYILLHELGHVLAIGNMLHPPWELPVSPERSPDKYIFSRLSWKVGEAGAKYSSLFDDEFSNRKDVAYYFGADLPAGQMVRTYEQLEQTNFPTLYAATKPEEDFAESFVTYVHSVLMARPFEIRIFRDGTLVKTYRSCWNEMRCAEKRKTIEQFLQLSPRP